MKVSEDCLLLGGQKVNNDADEQSDEQSENERCQTLAWGPRLCC